MSHAPLVYVVDNYAKLRSALKAMLEANDFEVVLCASGQSFLDQWQRDRPGVLILDYSMPQMNGLQLQEKLQEMRAPVPIVFLTGRATVPVAVTACQNGAVEFLQKPIDEPELIPIVRRHQERACEEFDQRREANVWAGRLNTLTPREREIVGHLTKGRNPKEIAIQLGTSHYTVQNQRRSILEKMQADSPTELLHMVNQVNRWDRPPSPSGN